MGYNTKLTDDDWLMSESNGHPVQSLGMRIVGRVLRKWKANQQ